MPVTRRSPARDAPAALAGPLTSHRWRVFFVAWAALSALCALWVFATPISASPDEPEHIVKAASVARGQWLGEDGAIGQVVQVPQYIAWAHNEACFAYNPDAPAGCAGATPEPTDATVDALTTAGRYNPVYYLLIGWPSLIFGDATGIYAMRLASAVLSSLFLALGAMLMASWRRPALPLASLAVIATPMVLFLGASVNPNAVEATSAVAVFLAMLSIVASDRRDLMIERIAVLVAGALLLVNARGLSPAWLAVVVVAPLLLAGWPRVRELLRRRSVIIAIVAVAAACVPAVVWLLVSNSLGAGIGAPPAGQQSTVGTPALYGFLWTLERTPLFVQHMIGIFGWLDTDSPPLVVFIWAAAFVTLLVAAIAVLRGRQLWTVVGLLVTSAVLPAALQAVYITAGGYVWQGRYNLALFLTVLAAAAALLSPHLPSRHTIVRRVWGIAVILFAFGHFYVFVVVLRRYVVGATETWLAFVTAPVWSPPGGTLVIVALGALVIAGVAVVAWRGVLAADAATEPLPKKRAAEHPLFL